MSGFSLLGRQRDCCPEASCGGKRSYCCTGGYLGGQLGNQIAYKCDSFGADGVSVFQGSQTGVTTQLKEKHAPFMLGVHCIAHRKNLAVQPISNLPIVAKLASLCQAMYAYFSDPLRRVLGEYKTLIVKICEDAALKEPDSSCKNLLSRVVHDVH
ncbi:hypothetical protein M758_UG065900 [Ceratodon purpureus]|nr:hypothetical protein M758_UG065900 [Ceratodon purpureus]